MGHTRPSIIPGILLFHLVTCIESASTSYFGFCLASSVISSSEIQLFSARVLMNVPPESLGIPVFFSNFFATSDFPAQRSPWKVMNRVSGTTIDSTRSTVLDGYHILVTSSQKLLWTHECNSYCFVVLSTRVLRWK
jgi:hypothetical protein